jgi:uncharacterized protein YcbK (DUF882 family)
MGDVSAHLDIVGDCLACRCGCDFGKKPTDFDPLLVEKFEQLRGFWGKGFVIDSGARCVEYNDKVGGESNSAHTPDSLGRCRALDIRLAGSADRRDMVLNAHNVGFKRIGIGKNFIHVDVAEDDQHPLGWWTYGDKRG